jgi:acyl-CoA synthetase (AMP-forming)/AMP-acid ligase II
MAGALLAEGLVTDDRVALVAPEVSSFVTAFFAISAAGLFRCPSSAPAQARRADLRPPDTTTAGRQARCV